MKLVKVSNDDIYVYFKKYFNDKLNYKVKKISIESIHPTSVYIHEKRLFFAKKLYDGYVKANVFPFLPCKLKSSDDKSRIVPPPIVEKRGDIYVLCDGTHRTYIAKLNQEKEIFVLVVDNPVLPLAGDITKWSDIRIVSFDYHSRENFINYNKEGFTGYSKFCNSDIFIRKED